MFEVYEKSFNIIIDGQEQFFKLKPLSGKDLGKFYKLLGKLSSGKEGDEFSIQKLDEESISLLHQLVTSTLLDSYPEEFKAGITDKKLDLFVSRNLLRFVEPLLKVNLPEQ